MNANDEIHALRCDRASILQELALMTAERDTLAALVDHVLLQYDRYHAGEAPADDDDALSWEKRARAVRQGSK